VQQGSTAWTSTKAACSLQSKYSFIEEFSFSESRKRTAEHFHDLRRSFFGEWEELGWELCAIAAFGF